MYDLYEKGMECFKNKEYQKALDYFLECKENLDYNWSTLYYALYETYGELKDKKNAEECLIRYSRLGDTYCHTKVAKIYLEGKYVDQDYTKAIKHLEDGSDAADIEADNILAEYYKNGFIVKKDLEKSKYYTELAEWHIEERSFKR